MVDVHQKEEWLSQASFYQIFIDRFNIGNEAKDKSYINLKWGEIPNPKSFAGGDIKGITKKLCYIKNLILTKTAHKYHHYQKRIECCDSKQCNNDSYTISIDEIETFKLFK